MKSIGSFIASLVLGSSVLFAQPGGDPLRGPQNVLPDGVIDGVVVKDELPVRGRPEYEYVRLADYVWSKRVFSRIDAREKMNQEIFYPYDIISDDWKFPKTRAEIDDKGWLKHQERWSLWTVVARHIILGDLTVFKVSSEENPLFEDGYQLKYPVVRKTKDDFFNDGKYRSAVSKSLSYGAKGKDMTINRPVSEDEWIVQKSGTSYEAWLDSLLHDPSLPVDPDNGLSDYEALERRHLTDSVYLRQAWLAAADGMALKEPDVVKYVTSQSITAYNIKEDWFFDKERSLLDKRIIAIAPVARLVYDVEKNSLKAEERDAIDRYSSFIGVSPTGTLEILDDGQPSDYNEEYVELELFWLYFPELRNVIANYYIYNDKSDAQWMSFDDLFWKRHFTSQIYRTSDKFDREIEDYRYGVDALYEAEKIKDDIRKWEHDVWNF